MTDDLDNKSDAELNELFAVEVCEIVKPIPSQVEGVRFYEDTRNGALRRSDWRSDFWTNFCTDANAVLPWLEKHRWSGHSNGMSGSTNGHPHFSIKVSETPRAEYPERFGIRHEGHGFRGDSLTHSFARAAVLALLRAKRTESKGE